jgi:hypothetical protein
VRGASTSRRREAGFSVRRGPSCIVAPMPLRIMAILVTGLLTVSCQSETVSTGSPATDGPAGTVDQRTGDDLPGTDLAAQHPSPSDGAITSDARDAASAVTDGSGDGGPDATADQVAPASDSAPPADATLEVAPGDAADVGAAIDADVQADAPADAAAATDAAPADAAAATDAAPADTAAATDAAAPADATDAGPVAPAPSGLTWARRVMAARPVAVSPLSDGAFLVTGQIRDGAIFGPGEPEPTQVRTNISSLDGFVARFGADGAFGWVQAFGGSGPDESGLAVRASAGGAVIVGGEFFADEGSGAITFGAGQANATSFTNTGSFVARYDHQGQLAWARATGGRESVRVAAVAALEDGGCIAVGNFYQQAILAPGTPQMTTLTAHQMSGGADGDSYLARYSADGTLLWARQLGGPASDYASAVTLVDGGDVVVAGSFGDTATFAGGHGSTQTLTMRGGSYDVYLARYTAAGDLVWARQLGGPAQEEARALVRLSSGDLAVAGIAIERDQGDEILFGAGEAHETTLHAHSFDLFLARYATDGRVVWAKGTRGASLALSGGIAATADGGLVVAAAFGGVIVDPPATSAVFAPGEPQETTLSPLAEHTTDLLLAWYAADGSLRKARLAGAAVKPYAQVFPRDVMVAPDGGAIVVGALWGSVLLGPGDPEPLAWQADDHGGTLNMFDGDMFIARYAP